MGVRAWAAARTRPRRGRHDGSERDAAVVLPSVDVADEFLRQGLDRVETGPPPGAGHGVDGADRPQRDARTVDERRPQIGTDTYVVDDRIAA